MRHASVTSGLTQILKIFGTAKELIGKQTQD
jgi:hypothetical protein